MNQISSLLMRSRVCAGVLITLFCSGFNNEVVAEEIIIGLRAHIGVEKSMQRWQETAKYLTNRIDGYSFRIIPFDKLNALSKAAANGEFDYVITNPSSYVEMEINSGASRMLTLINKRRGLPYTSFGAVIFTRNDHPDILSLKDLHGKSLMAVSEPAFGGWRVAWGELLKNGIDPEQDLASVSFAGGVQQNVVYAVRDGKVDVGVVRTDMLERMADSGDIQLDEFHAVGQIEDEKFPFMRSTALYPEWAFARFPNTSVELSQNVARMLLELSEKSKAAKTGKYVGWSVPLNYQPVHELLKTLKIGPYKDYGKVTLLDTFQSYKYWIFSFILTILVIIVTGSMALKRTRQLSQLRSQLLKEKDRELLSQKLALDEHAIVSITDVKGNITYANDRFCTISGYSRDELLGQNHRLLKSGEHTDEMYSDLWRTIANGKIWHGEIKNKQKEGGIYWVDATIVPFLNDQGKPFQYVAIRTDITKTKTISADLLESEERFRSISDSSSVAMNIAINDKGNIVYWNRAAELSFGYSKSEILGKPVTDIIPLEYRGAHNYGFQNALDTGTYSIIGSTVEIEGLKKSGEKFEIELSLGTWKNGDETFFSAVIHDISERKRTEKALIEKQTQAEAANIAKSNFLATMSHEIRTPLNGVLGLTQLLRSSDLDIDQRKKVDTILSSGQTLLSIINDVLDMSKIEAGGVQLEEQIFSLTDLISTILSPFQSLVDDKGIDLVVKNDLPSAYTIKGDQVRLRQILWNLLSNAIKFTDKGQIILTIQNSGAVENDYGLENPKDQVISFTIEDTGIGISSDRLESIFNTFTQEDTSIARKYGGTGLGLSISKQLVELMGGSINVKSKQGEGTAFFVHLPFDSVTIDEAEDHAQRVAGSKAENITSMNILVVEDNDINAMIAIAFLKMFGHKTKHVVNGKLAVEEVKEGWADLILMDIHMPEMNGIDATIAIRSMGVGKYIPIVGLTAEAFTERHAQFRDAGMDDILTKPFTEEQLANILAANRYIEQHGENDVIELTPIAIDVKSKTTPVGDDEELEVLRQKLGSEKILFLLEETQSFLLGRMDDLHQALKDKNSELIREIAHSIKGTCSSMYAIEVSELAAEIENKSSDIKAVSILLPKIESAATAAIEWWQVHRDS